MDYTAKLNFQRLELKNDQLYNDYVQFLSDKMKKVATKHYELTQARICAKTFMDEKKLPENLSYRLRTIALCYYRINYA